MPSPAFPPSPPVLFLAEPLPGDVGVVVLLLALAVSMLAALVFLWLGRSAGGRGTPGADHLAWLRNGLRLAPSAIAFRRLDGQLLLSNPRAEAMPVPDQAATLCRNPEGVVPPDRAAQIRAQDEQVLNLGHPLQTEESLPQPDGSVRDYLVQKFPLLDAQERCCGMGAIATDITARRAAERDQVEYRRRESLCLLAGGISHDFNNLLGAMIGNVELARMELAEDAPVRSRLQALEELITRASALVEQMLANAGKGKYQLQTLDLNRVVEDLIRILRPSLAGRTRLDWERGPGPASMAGRLAQIQQVFVNLVMNAAEAVNPQDGVITIRTGILNLDPAERQRRFPGQALAPGPLLTLEVADNGRGMTAEVQERIFEPFFTTKLHGRGLGLAAVQGILRSHEGGIRVRSEPGAGSSFLLAFPALAGEPPAPAPEPVPESGFQGSGTILVVDDEEPLRGVAVATLRGLGFDTLEARDGQEALRVFAAHRERIRLVLMNLTMPAMDGEEAYRKLRAAGARTPVILSSGLSEEEALRRFQGTGLAGYLQRPYRRPQLVELVRAALGSHPSRGG